jgi:ABC-2 type transport system ATP-binding protein
MTDDLVIESHALTKRYGQQRGVVDLDLEVRAGEVFGFLGPNGAGKSTTIHLLLGLIRPSAGAAAVLGRDCWRDRDAVQRGVGFLPGELAFPERLTGSEVVHYLATLRGGVSTQVVAGLVERFDVEMDRPVRDLSTGNKQKLGLVQAFMHEPPVVILDEPTLGLDPLVQREFQRLVREVQAEGRTVFLSSHILSEVERVVDRVGIIREGELVEVAAIERLKQLAVRRVDFEFAWPVDPASFAGIEGVRRVEADGPVVRVEVEGSMTRVMKVAADHEIIDLHLREADLEEIFLGYYRSGAESGRVS